MVSFKLVKPSTRYQIYFNHTLFIFGLFKNLKSDIYRILASIPFILRRKFVRNTPPSGGPLSKVVHDPPNTPMIFIYGSQLDL